MTDRVIRDPADRLISAAAAALKLGVDVATLVRWHSSNCGPAAIIQHDGTGLGYRCSDLEAWQDRIGAGASSGPRGGSTASRPGRTASRAGRR